LRELYRTCVMQGISDQRQRSHKIITKQGVRLGTWPNLCPEKMVLPWLRFFPNKYGKPIWGSCREIKT
jgi:hypothetical protein